MLIDNDSMRFRQIFLSLLALWTMIHCAPAAAAAYALGSGPFVVEDLGSPVSANTQDRQVMFTLNGDKHLILYYDVQTVWKNTIQILDVNLTRRSHRLVPESVFGRPGSFGTALSANGKLYLGSSDPGYLFEYDPTTGATNFITALNTNTPGQRRDTQTMEFGNDGWLYIGQYGPVGGGVGRYHPTDGVFQDLGYMDTSYNAPQYAYTVGADTRYVYVGLGQQPWYLAIYDTATSNKTVYWRNEEDTSGSVYRGTNGSWYYFRTATNGIKYYILTNGLPTELSFQPTVIPWYERGNVIHDIASFSNKFGVEINLDDAYPDNLNNSATVYWRNSGEANWPNSTTATNFRIEPINLRRVYAWSGNRLFAFADFYGSVFSYDIGTSEVTGLGRPTYSLYDAAFGGPNIYLSGYSAVTLRYNTNSPWTLSASTVNKSNPSGNPYKIGLAMGKYHYYSCFGSDGLLYVGSHHERDSTGGELGWYDPSSGASGSLRTPFLAFDVRDLKPALGRTKMVYASGNDRLFVFDVATKQIERTIIPIPGIGPLDKVVEVSPGIVFGATSNRIFKVDIRNGAILYTNTIPGAAFGGSAIATSDHRLILGPDSCVWMFIGNSLYRINPTDGSLTKVLDTPAKSLLFKDGDIYLYGGPNLHRIPNALVSAILPPSSLHVSQ